MSHNGNHQAGRGLSVALVYPPYGPAAVPSLGLALLSAGIKARGFPCTTFYWNLDFIRELPRRDFAAQERAYRFLSQRLLMPYNEWVFGGVLYGDAMAERDAELTSGLATWFEPRRRHLGLTSEDVLGLRSRAPGMVAAMADRLEPYDVIGIGSTFFQNVAALALARTVKARWPGKIVVMGGANCDGEMGTALFEQFPFLDYVFVGEVDHAFPEFVERRAGGQSVADLPGIVFREGQEVRCGPPPTPLGDLEGLPVPDFDDYVAARAQGGIDTLYELCLPLESSRGCWWGAKQHCTFCGLNADGMNYRHKSADRFRAEVETTVERYGARYFFMTDNILSMSYYKDFMEWAAEGKRGLHFFYEIKANVNRKQAQRLANAGVTLVQPGIESFSTKILQRMRKGTTGIQNVAFLKYAREHGILCAYNILAGFPGEEQDEYARMAEQVPDLVHLQPPSAIIGIEYHRFSPYHFNAESYGLRLRASPRYQYIYPFPEPVIDRLAYVFERRDEDAPDQSYIEPLAREISNWRKHHTPGDCTLTWRWAGVDILICDRRLGRLPRTVRLRDFAVSVFRRIDEPKSLPALVSQATDEEWRPDPSEVLSLVMGFDLTGDADGAETVSFSKEEFLADPAACMNRLRDGRLVYVEGDRYLALPVAHDRPPFALQWLQLGV